MKFRFGDIVTIVSRDSHNITGWHDYQKPNGDVGKTGFIKEIGRNNRYAGDQYSVFPLEDVDNQQYYGWFREQDLRLASDNNNSKEKNMSDTSKKYYRVVKEHPMYETGAILQRNTDSSSYGYKVVDSIFNKDIDGADADELEKYTEGREIVEHSEWFERVYPLGKLEKMVFGTKKQAQAAAAAMYKDAK